MNGETGAAREIHFSVSIGAHTWLEYYRGPVRDVVVTARDGRVVRFPARVLQRFVSREGVHGQFVLRYDEGGRFQSIERV